jgi:hypothetical protein
MDELFDEFALVAIEAFDFSAEHAWRVDLVELFLQGVADDGFAMAHERETAFGIVKVFRSDSGPGADGGVESFEPIGVARDGGPGIAKDNRENVLVELDGEFECAAVKALEEAVVGACAFGKEVDKCGADTMAGGDVGGMGPPHPGPLLLGRRGRSVGRVVGRRLFDFDVCKFAGRSATDATGVAILGK